jgi:hypothetical protein
MGTLSRIGLAELVQAHGLDTLVEAGTGHGHSLLAALQVPALTDIRSIEIDYETWHRARVVFSTEPRVRLYCGDSSAVLRSLVAELGGRKVLWFLDAHFPGSGRLEPVSMLVKGDPAAAVPIAAELTALLTHRDLSRDVVVVDDLCLFEAGSYESDAPDLRASLGLRSLRWLDGALGRTHELTRLTLDGGYLIARPRAGRNETP